MATKTAEGLVKHVKQCLEDEWGYVYGALGQTCTESLLDQCARIQQLEELIQRKD